MRTRLLKTRKRKGSADSAHVHRQSAYELARDIAAKQSLRCLLREKNICLAPRPHYSSWSMGLGHVVRARQFVSERYPNVLTDYVNFLKMTVCNFVQNNFKKQTGQFVINVKGASIKDSQNALKVSKRLFFG